MRFAYWKNSTFQFPCQAPLNKRLKTRTRPPDAHFLHHSHIAHCTSIVCIIHQSHSQLSGSLIKSLKRTHKRRGTEARKIVKICKFIKQAARLSSWQLSPHPQFDIEKRKKKTKITQRGFAVFPGTNTLLHFNAPQMRRRGKPGHMDKCEYECECECEYGRLRVGCAEYTHTRRLVSS